MCILYTYIIYVPYWLFPMGPCAGGLPDRPAPGLPEGGAPLTLLVPEAVHQS